jgi:hypothetical protein
MKTLKPLGSAWVAPILTLVSLLTATPGDGADPEPAMAAPGPIAQPRPHSISYYYDALEQSFTRPISRLFDPALAIKKIAGNRREAANVDARDQVHLPSAWWQPRLGFQPVSVEQMRRGPGPGTGPRPGPWIVTRAKTEGVSAGFQMKDADGNRFAIKFDPPRFLELATGADVVVSKLYWAAGFNVPDNSIATIRREDLQIDPKATVTDAAGRKKPMTEAFLDELLKKAPSNGDGSYRVIASRLLGGVPLGEWEYDGRRSDDPEDWIPHQHRREIRGMWILNAWLNHTDCSARNTLDMWVTEGGRSFVRHHLIDFSGCLGSASIDQQSPRGGHEYLLDFGAAAASLVTLGLRKPSWEDAVDPNLPSVGFIDSKTFDPDGWKPFLPNPAFDERTDRDVRWGARIVAAFTDEHIRAAVAEGRYSDPRAAEYLTRILIERRDKIVRHWLGGERSVAASPR